MEIVVCMKAVEAWYERAPVYNRLLQRGKKTRLPLKWIAEKNSAGNRNLPPATTWWQEKEREKRRKRKKERKIERKREQNVFLSHLVSVSTQCPLGIPLHPRSRRSPQ